MNKQLTTSTPLPAFSLARVARSLAILSAAAVLSACSGMRPAPLGAADTLPVNQADRQAMRKDVEPIAGPLTLENAIARALKYNLDRRSRMMEEVLALNQFDVSQYDMLPKLVAQAGYLTRDSDRISLSRNAATGDLSPSQFISQERNRVVGDLGMTWNLLDFGMGYFGARQQADRYLIASEKRRRAMHLLMQDVRTAFWRAASAQKLQADVEKTIAAAEEALADARRAEEERVRNPMDTLRYQRQLLENLRLLEAVSQELTSAQVELAALINAPFGSRIEVAEMKMDGAGAELLKLPVQDMEEVALAQNPDLREQHYNARIAREETRRTMVRLFPNVSFGYNLKYDSDKYLVHRQWNEAGLQLTANLMNLFTGPAQIRLAEAGVALADQRRMATQLSVLTQVHLGRLQLINARNQFERADAIYGTDQKIATLSRNRESAQAQSKLERVSNDTAAILGLLRRYQALAQVQKIESQLLASLGLEPAIGSTSELSLAQLTEQVGRSNDPLQMIRAAGAKSNAQ